MSLSNEEVLEKKTKKRFKNRYDQRNGNGDQMIIINDNVDPQTGVSGGWAGQEGQTKIQWEIPIENRCRRHDHFFYWKYENSDHNYDGDDHYDDSY